MSITIADARGSTVPPTALLLSLVALAVPVASASLFPHWTNADVGILVWLLALIPPFLLSYYRGWRGTSAALAAAMAAFALSQVLLTLSDAEPPAPRLMLGISVVLIGVSLGSAVLSTLFHQALERAERSALTDPGTGLPNRRHGMVHLQRAFAAAERGAPLSVILFDLDRFKSINDRLGHGTGDDVLRVFTEVLDEHTRAMNLTARFGGEEFLTILDGVDAEGATVMAERVMASLRERPFSWGRATVSAGICEYEPGMASPEVLVAAADQALYRAKARGGDTVVTLAPKGSGPGAVSLDRPGAGAPPTPGRGELVLVVDDDAAVLRTLGKTLRRRGYRALEAVGAEAALRLASELMEPIDLVVTDVVMPDMSGFRLVEMLMEVQPELRALYISGYSSEEVRWSGVPGVVKAFLPKPISIHDLVAAVRSSLDAPIDPHAAAAAPAGTANPERVTLLCQMVARELGLDDHAAADLERHARAAGPGGAPAPGPATGTATATAAGPRAD